MAWSRAMLSDVEIKKQINCLIMRLLKPGSQYGLFFFTGPGSQHGFICDLNCATHFFLWYHFGKGV